VSYFTAGHPSLASFAENLRAVAEVSDVVEVGVPFSDPMADGFTIQESSRIALENGVSLRWILDAIEALPERPAAPLVLFGYLNPLLAFGFERLADRCAEVGVSGFIVPDLPFEESEPFRAAIERRGLGLIQLVTPVTPRERAAQLAQATRGVLYAVTRTGITGQGAVSGSLTSYLGGLRKASPLPVCAGFGIRTPEQVAEIAPHADGVVVGSALVELLGRGEDPRPFLAGLVESA
jgi:tryptophan synthase alpha chain